MKSRASSSESHCHETFPTQGCDLTRDMIPRQEPRRNKRLPGALKAVVGALKQGLGVQLGRSVALQLEALIMVSTETTACWSAALPPNPAFMAAGNPHW